MKSITGHWFSRSTKAVLCLLGMGAMLWFELVVALPGLIAEIHDDVG